MSAKVSGGLRAEQRTGARGPLHDGWLLRGGDCAACGCGDKHPAAHGIQKTPAGAAGFELEMNVTCHRMRMREGERGSPAARALRPRALQRRQRHQTCGRL